MKIFKNLVLSLFSILITLLIIEIFLSFFYPQAKNGSWRIQNDDGVFINKDNGKAKHEFIGEREKISITYKFGKFHNRIIYNDEYYKDKNRILVLGDSNIFGWLLEDKDTFIAKIQKYFENYYFINSAAGGFSDTDMYLYINRYCKNIKPEYLLYFVDINRSIEKKNMSLDSADNLIIKKNKRNNLKDYLNDKKVFYFLLENSHFIQLLKRVYLNFSDDAYINHVKATEENAKGILKSKNINSVTSDFELVKKLYNEIINESNLCNTKLIFIDLGWHNKNYNSKIYNYVTQNFNSMFDKSKNIKFISLYDEMRLGMTAGKIYKLEEGHPNAEGNHLIYNILKNKLKPYLD